MYGCGTLFLSILPQIQKRRKATLLLLLVVCKQALLQAKGRDGRVFGICGAGVGGAFVARCIGVWATARRSLEKARRAFILGGKLFAGCYVFVSKS